MCFELPLCRTFTHLYTMVGSKIYLVGDLSEYKIGHQVQKNL